MKSSKALLIVISVVLAIFVSLNKQVSATKYNKCLKLPSPLKYENIVKNDPLVINLEKDGWGPEVELNNCYGGGDIYGWLIYHTPARRSSLNISYRAGFLFNIRNNSLEYKLDPGEDPATVLEIISKFEQHPGVQEFNKIVKVKSGNIDYGTPSLSSCEEGRNCPAPYEVAETSDDDNKVDIYFNRLPYSDSYIYFSDASDVYKYLENYLADKECKLDKGQFGYIKRSNERYDGSIDYDVRLVGKYCKEPIEVNVKDGKFTVDEHYFKYNSPEELDAESGTSWQFNTVFYSILLLVLIAISYAIIQLLRVISKIARKAKSSALMRKLNRKIENKSITILLYILIALTVALYLFI